jgi:phosphatidylserine decarboxylase
VYNFNPVKSIRNFVLIVGWSILLLSALELVISGTNFQLYSAPSNVIGFITGVFLIWLSIEKVHPEGYKFFIIFFITSVLFGFIVPFLGLLGFLLTVFVLWFFRDPERIPPSIEGVVSPADGVICKIDQASPPRECSFPQGDFLRICVFMNVFNVHVNRSPINAKVSDIIYVKGKFFNASLDKASEDNERNILVLEDSQSEKIIVVQIAGLIARRILSFVKPLSNLAIGERFGLIRFGSRVDVYLPKTYTTDLIEGTKVVAGETIIARKV